MSKMQPHLDTLAIYGVLKKAEPDEIVTYENLNKTINGDVQNAQRGYLTSARKMAFREYGKVFRPIINVGMKCLADGEKANLATTTIKHIHKISRRTANEIASVKDFDSLPPERKIQHNTGLTLLGFMDHCTKPKHIKQLQTKVEEATASLSMSKTLDCFRDE